MVIRVAWLVWLAAAAAGPPPRWSRQVGAEFGDWIPVPGPLHDRPELERRSDVKRQVAQPRILAEPVFPRLYHEFPSRMYMNTAPNRQLYPQASLADQGFGPSYRHVRFNANHPLTMLNAFESVQKMRPVAYQAAPVQPAPFRFEQPLAEPAPLRGTAGGAAAGAGRVDGYRLDAAEEFMKRPPAQSLQRIRFEQDPPPAPKSEREEIQLVYVPVDALNKKAAARDPPPVFRDPQPTLTDARRPPAPGLLRYDLGQSLYPAFNARLPERDQETRHTTLSPPFLTAAPTTPAAAKPRKLKPHQPPLAVFLAQEARKGAQVKVSDVLGSLKNAQTIAVLDAVDPQRAPKVFIGPSTLVPPENYVKFELPYLSNIENSDRKLRQLPFFVAPLSYNTPDGFAKIPFPSPHVGSVIVNSGVRDGVRAPPLLAADVIPNSYSGAALKPAKTAQKPTFTYYTTAAPHANTQQAVTSNYYTFEQQNVTPLNPKISTHGNAPLKTNYIIDKTQYEQQANRIQYEQNFQTVPTRTTTVPQETTPRDAAQRTTEGYQEVASLKPTPTPPPSTYPSQLLETHNPYSINQAFHLSTPLDQTFNEEDSAPATPPAPTPTSTTEAPVQVSSEKPSSSTFQTFSPDYGRETETTATTPRPRRPALDERPTRHRFPSSEYQDVDSTSTKRAPIRSRGRPRVPAPPQRDADTAEKTTRLVEKPTRRPLRRPSPTRARYEPNRIVGDKPTRKPYDYSEEDATTKASRERGRPRGRVQFSPVQDNEDNDYEVDENKAKTGKKEDLAYQRDVLHQNYPVTLMERMSTAVDIEAITDPVPRISSTTEATTEVFDPEQSNGNEQFSSSKDEEWSRPAPQTEAAAAADPTVQGDFMYFTKGMSALAPAPVDDSADISKFAPKPEPNKELNQYTKSNEFFSREEATTPKEYEASTEKVESPQTTAAAPPSHRIRVRPGRVQTPTAEPTTTTTTTRPTGRPDARKRPAQPVTYRPAYDRRRTTMRIDEIEADLKTKPVNARPEQDHRHPVYRPEPTPPPSATLSYSETTTKRGQFRRRRPAYSTTTESAEQRTTKKSVYEVNKSRFKGRRTTEKPSEKTETTEREVSSTARPVSHSRYARPRLSEKYNKRTEKEEDQETNYSINSPRFATPEDKTDEWSKYTVDSFKPYNPNEIAEDRKTTDRRPETDIITARNDYEELLFPVTPASNKLNQRDASETTRVPAEETTFESMIEEVMKSLEERDEHEYQGSERQASELKKTEYQVDDKKTDHPVEEEMQTRVQEAEATTPAATSPEPAATSPAAEDQKPPKPRRRGFWKKVKVRPVSEALSEAESQYYSHAVNRLGDPVQDTKLRRTEAKVTTYKPSIRLPVIPDNVDDEELEQDITLADIVKIRPEVKASNESKTNENGNVKKESAEVKETTTASPGEQDLGTGTPDPTIMDMFYNPTTTEAGDTGASINRSDGFSFIDYLFGVTAPEENNTERTVERVTETTESKKEVKTTDATFVPEEIATEANEVETSEVGFFDIQKVTVTERPRVENKTELTPVVTTSSYMNPDAVLSTSMSTEISHETEICFRGKCIKTKKDVL